MPSYDEVPSYDKMLGDATISKMIKARCNALVVASQQRDATIKKVGALVSENDKSQLYCVSGC